MIKLSYRKTMSESASERAPQINPQVIEEIVRKHLPHLIFKSYELLIGGCTNLSFKLRFDCRKEPLLLRIYWINKEKNIHINEYRLMKSLFEENIPIPKVYHCSTHENYRYILMQYIEGRTIEEILFDENEVLPCQAIYSLGLYLAFIHKISLSKFDRFILNASGSVYSYEHFVESFEEVLIHLYENDKINIKIFNKIKYILHKQQSKIPKNHWETFTHGDCLPKNVMLTNIGRQWQLQSIMDWEFARVFHPFRDIASFLRYAHHLPSEFEKSLINGLILGGFSLGDNWRMALKLIDLHTLLIDLAECEFEQIPNTYVATLEFIIYTVNWLNDHGNNLG